MQNPNLVDSLLSPNLILIDFEKAMANAIKQVFASTHLDRIHQRDSYKNKRLNFDNLFKMLKSSEIDITILHAWLKGNVNFRSCSFHAITDGTRDKSKILST